jgi:alginate O-acetyltransferase complex protein AlgI
MTLTHIAIAAGLAVITGWLLPSRWRGWLLMIASVIAVYWLSPALTIRSLDFVLPTATLVLAVAVWWFTRPAEATLSHEDRVALGLLAALVIGLSATRYLVPELRPTPSRAPDVLAVAVGLALAGLIIWLLGKVGRGRRGFLMAVILGIVAIFVVLKAEPLALLAAGGLRRLSGQQADLARVTDLTWLGFSYVAFRLIHMLRDRQAGKLPELGLREALTYVIFFPALVAGPIDRAERFIRDYRVLPDIAGLDAARWVEGGTRILVGIFKKFVVADSLVLLALTADNAGQFTSAWGGWVLVYGYGLRLFLDFSGYSDIAIGIGILFGIKLPENFERPYLKTSVTAFWQSWHITLSNWARFYVFSPLSRALMLRQPRPPMLAVVFVSQVATMLVIGLWHGVSWTFVAWGLWHAAGLFVHKWWGDRMRKTYLGLKERPRLKWAWDAGAWLVTLQFVMLGWVWFALPEIGQAGTVFLKLFGIGW